MVLIAQDCCEGPDKYFHYDVINWKHFLRYWPFVRGIHRWPVDSPHKGPVTTQTFDVTLLLVWTNGWTNTRLTGNSRRHDCHLTLPQCLTFTLVIVIPVVQWFNIYDDQAPKGCISGEWYDVELVYTELLHCQSIYANTFPNSAKSSWDE